MKRIYTGWYTDCLRLRWTEECRRDLLSGRRRFRFLLPTRHLIRKVRESLTGPGLGVSDQIGTFDDLVDLGLTKEKRVLRIDEQGKLAVLTRALELAGREAIAPFRRIAEKPGFLQSLMEAIEEMKSSGVPEESLLEWTAESGAVAGGNGDSTGGRSGAYVAAFAEIYRLYQQLLREYAGGRLLDRQEGYRVAAGHLLEHGDELLCGIDKVYIDFLTVTPLQFPIVEAVCRHVPQVEVFMPYPSGAEGIERLLKSRDRLIAALRRWGVEHVDLETEEGRRVLAGKEWNVSGMALLARTVFAENAKRLPNPGVELIPSASPLQEVRAVAKEIKRLVRDGWNAEEIAIVAADDAVYRPLIRRVFRENRIAVDLAEIQNLAEIPLVHKVMRAVEEGQADFSEKAAYARHAESVRQLVSRLQLTEKLFARAASGGVYGLEDLRRDIRAWQACRDILESLVRAKRLYGDREVPFSLFWKEWKELLRQGKVQVDAGAGQGVKVCRPAEMRGLSYRAVFLLGLNEGRYPKKPGDHWLIERIEREADKRGFVLQRREQAELQNLLFRNCVQAADRLYLGFQSPDADERNLPSPYLEAIVRCLEDGEWKAPARFQSALSMLPLPDRWEELSSRREWRERVAVWLGGELSLHVGAEPDAAAFRLLKRELDTANGADGTVSLRQILRRLDAERERDGGQPSRFAGRLHDPAIRSVLRERFGPNYPWSVSALNDYAVCPFKFFAARVLKIQPKDPEAEGIPVDERGSFLHRLVQRLFLPLTKEPRVGPAQIQQVLAGYDAVFEETCREWEGTALTGSPYWPAEKLRLHKEMRLWLERELGNLLQSRMRPVHLEWSFGGEIRADDRQPPDPDSTEERIALRIGRETMRVQGRIDRIDLAEDGTRFAVYDYKTSLNPKKYKGIRDLQEGTNWQLPLYLAAYSEWSRQQGAEIVPLGGGFQQMSALPGKMAGVWADDVAMWGITEIKKADLTDNLQMLLEESLQQVAGQWEALRGGVFDARPRTECDPYCQYLSVCRFDPAKKERTT